MSARILVVEDEQHLAAGLKLNLELEGYRADVAKTVRDAGFAMVDPEGYDLIVLDVMLPDADGFTFCEKLRDAGNYTPVIMLTARSAPEDRVRGLEAGADDYLGKPFELEELLARVRSLLRRSHWTKAQGPSTNTLHFGRVFVDFDAHVVVVDEAPVTMTQLEFELLHYFAANAGRVLSRAELLEKVWKLHHHPRTRTVDNFIVRLRRHLEPDPARPVHILSVRGAGYKFQP